MKKIFDIIQEHLRDNLIGLTAGEYQGEFENDADWSPVFPIALMELSEITPDVFTSDGSAVHSKIKITAYIGNKTSALDLVESVINALNGARLDNLPDAYPLNYAISVGTCVLHGWIKNVSVYRLEVFVS